ncbi:MAG: hypothetical protein P5702_16415 [Limnospira sp. PMC 1291.21]|uniref:Uncharacterized protein n=2 Tax=Limnospira TaxID=2596745 RepID=A0A9P1P1V3_9CYAN|nr:MULTISPECIES: hypothetical protein [Limnospira]EDZ91975.1 hypothetical protein AmaxDRAFT_5257 [Limnospira maxima CS-328]MDC0838865.1 hypothetical protein [Limnoraphis robusta]MDT9189347.1 hypothetical protein [Limnospira sp. PMC 894.15]MDT9286263.1 hypothetical protein [Limnospira sp. PMC 1298.21]MDT9317111.1 hypothetical protein [Limnospira sp. PMC 1306.21]MDY7053677.1 hypothetical protein [Limnospira fusiformis LS22]QJB25726.1 hypothetical protein HFV01_07925 [Limnospira fusiformis SAG 
MGRLRIFRGDRIYRGYLPLEEVNGIAQEIRARSFGHSVTITALSVIMQYALARPGPPWDADLG